MKNFWESLFGPKNLDFNEATKTSTTPKPFGHLPWPTSSMRPSDGNSAEPMSRGTCGCVFHGLKFMWLRVVFFVKSWCHLLCFWLLLDPLNLSIGGWRCELLIINRTEICIYQHIIWIDHVKYRHEKNSTDFPWFPAKMSQLSSGIFPFSYLQLQPKIIRSNSPHFGVQLPWPGWPPKVLPCWPLNLEKFQGHKKGETFENGGWKNRRMDGISWLLFFWLTFFEDPKSLGDLFHIAFWKVDMIATEELFLMESWLFQFFPAILFPQQRWNLFAKFPRFSCGQLFFFPPTKTFKTVGSFLLKKGGPFCC